MRSYLLVLLLIWTYSTHCLGQSPLPTLRDVSSSSSRKMIDEYENHKIYQREHRKEYQYNLPYYEDIEDGLIKLIRKGEFYDDRQLTLLLVDIKRKLLENYSSNLDFVHVLVDKSFAVNAYAIGRCTVVLNNGLMAEIPTEEQLAYIISHEIAHLELNHLYKKQSLINQGQFKDGLKNLLSDKLKTEEIDTLKDDFYQLASYSREWEEEADSLGFIIYQKSYANRRAPLEALRNISVTSDIHNNIGLKLFRPFHFKNAPFNENLLRKDISHFSNPSSKVLFMERDSITSHPDSRHRYIRLKNQIELYSDLKPSAQNDISWVNMSSHIELIQECLTKRAYVLGLYHALKLKYQFPANKVTSTLIVKVLLQIHDDKRDGLFQMRFSRFTGRYSDDQLMVHNFVRNISYEEVAGLTYNFLGLSKNFDSKEPSHYELLMSVCERMGRMNEVQKVNFLYRERFN